MMGEAYPPDKRRAPSGRSEDSARPTPPPTPDRPLITAVITTYDRPAIVRRAIESVLLQTYGPLEIVVVEDGSESGLEGWLEARCGGGVRYLRHERNRGLAAARNTGLKAARGELVAYLDDDDEWKPTRIQRQVELLLEMPPEARTRMGVIYSRSELVLGRRTHVWTTPLNQGPLKESILRVGISTLSSTALFRRAALEAVGGFDEALESSIDHDIWMALAAAGFHAAYVDESLVRTHDRHGRRTMMTDSERRIRGVDQFLEKWRGTWEDWLGLAAAAEHMDAYFRRVVSALVAATLVEGRLREAGAGVGALRRRNGLGADTVAALVRAAARAVLRKARRSLPARRRLEGSAQ